MWKALALACSAYCSSYVLTYVKRKEGVLSSKAQNTTALLERCLQCQNRQGSVRFRWSGMYCMGLRQVPPAAWCGGSCSGPVCTTAGVLCHMSACCHCMQTSQRRRRNASSVKGCRFSTLNCPARSVMSPLAGVPDAHHLHGGLGVGATQNQRQTSESF